MGLYVLDNVKLYEADEDNLVHLAFGDTVWTGCQVVAHGSPDMGVRVGAGTMRYGGVLRTVAQTDLTVTAADPTNPRVDLVRIDGTTGVPAITAGTATSTPKPPALPGGSILVGFVSVAAAAANIQSANITDRRLIAGDGIVAGTLANRPAANAVPVPTIYYATDDNAGTLYRSDGATWTALSANVAIGKYLDQGDKGAVALTFDWTAATSQRVRMIGNPSSIAFTAPPAGTWVGMEFVQDGTGGRVLPAFPAAVKWLPGGVLPTFVTTLNSKTLISGMYDGTDYLLTAAANA